MQVVLSHYQWAVFVAMGGGESLVRMMADSAGSLPPGSFAQLPFRLLGERLIALTATSMGTVCSIVLPFAALCFLIEAGFGLTAKLSVNFNLSHEAFAAKTVLVFFTLIVLGGRGLEWSLDAILRSFSLFG